MKNTILLLTTALALCIQHSAFGQNVTPSVQHLSFTENKGQVHDQNGEVRNDILFSGQTESSVFHLKQNGVSYQLYRNHSVSTFNGKSNLAENTSMEIYRVDVSWLNSNDHVRVSAGKQQSEVKNYYNTDAANGITGVASYDDITYTQLYSGIDMKWYSVDGQLKYDFIIAPGADHQLIKMKIEGATSLRVDESGALIIETPFGVLSEDAPAVFQNGEKLKAAWKVEGNIAVYEIAGRNPKQEMIIDPAVHVWGTYAGSSLVDVVYGVDCDSTGNVIITGFTNSNTGIATSGAHQTNLAGNNDAFVRRYNVNGVLLWSTYYGGSQLDRGQSCVMDRSGNIYVTGQTRSTSGIATAGAHQTTLQGSGTYDAYLVKFNSSGTRQWGTYYGGSSDEYPMRLSSDTSGNVFMCGYTNSSSGIALGGHQNTLGAGGNFDAFLAKFNPSGGLQWGTYYGSTGSEFSYGCATAPNGDVYLAGSANSSGVIATGGAFQTTFGGGASDGFLVRFDSNGVRIWGTFYGSTGNDQGNSCAVDDLGYVYLIGYTASTSGISSGTVHQSAYGGGLRDVYVAQFTNSGSRIWASYLGGTDLDESTCAYAADGGGVYVGGFTLSGTSIATVGAPQNSNGGGQDGFVSLFTPNGSLDWSSYYGGASTDHVWSCANSNSIVYIAGQTSSTNNISTAGSAQASYGGDVADGYLAQFSYCATVNATLSATSNISCFGSNNGSATVTATGGSGITYSWAPSGGSSATATGLSAGTYTCTITNNCSSSTTVTVNITEPAILSSNASAPSILCNGGTTAVSVNATGGTAPYSGTGTFTVNAGNYTYVITDTNGCVDTASINITEPAVLAASITGAVNPSGCNAADGSIDLAVSGGTPGYNFMWSNSATTEDVSALIAGVYSVVITDANGCTNTASATLNDPPLPSVGLNLNIDTACSSSTLLIALSGGTPAGGSFSGPGVSGGNFNPSAAGLGTHTITYSYTDSLGCSNVATDIVFVDVCSGISSSVDINSFQIAPNPNNGVFVVQSATIDPNTNVTITDVTGRAVLHINNAFSNANRIEIDLTEYGDGVYFVTIQKESGAQVSRIVTQH